MNKFTYSLMLFIFQLPLIALACFVPPTEYYVDAESLVKRTKNIYYAEVVRKDGLNYEFKVLENLKPDTPNESSLWAKFLSLFHTEELPEVPNFFLQGDNHINKTGDYNGHSDKDFWDVRSAGRTEIAPDCQLHFAFEVGKKYLVFVNEPYHFKSFEEVNSKDDKWYQKVKELARK